MKKIILLKKIRYFLIFFLFLSLKSYAAPYTNTWCYVKKNGMHDYSLNYTLKVDTVSASTPNGAVVGKMLARKTTFTCSTYFAYSWRLQTSPNASAIPGSQNICQTNVDGIGIQYLDISGQPISCNSWGYIFELPANADTADIEEGTVLANLIKTGSHVGNGPSTLILPSSLLAYFYGNSSSTAWGNLVLQGSGDIEFSQYQAEIYFPSSPRSMPIVDLQVNSFLHKRGTLGKGPDTTIDMCLYDGNDTKSRGLKLTFSDNVSGITGRSSGLFSIFRNGGNKNKEQDRVDYTVSILNPINGSKQEIKNGVDIYWSGVNDRKILRQVVLPDVPGVSLCVPAPITFSTPLQDISGKIKGNYSGVLTVTYTPST